MVFVPQPPTPLPNYPPNFEGILGQVDNGQLPDDIAIVGGISSSGTAGVGYATGAGGTVTQITSKSTGVTLNKICGTITMDAAALASLAVVTFTVTNSTVAATDVVVIQHDSGGTVGSYLITPNTMAAGSFKVSVTNITAGSLSEALVLRFAVLKAAVA